MAPYDTERDACGIGFVADARGRGSRSIVDSTLEALCRVRHRGAVAADELTGDGAGVLLPLPRALIAEADEDESRLGSAMCFLDPETPETGRAAVEEACRSQGLALLRWRAVPVEPSALGDAARASQPVIEQAIVERPHGTDEAEAERRAFRARRVADVLATEHPGSLYISSFSFRTVTYKALCAADQLGAFYPDLVDQSYVAWFGIFHQRYSTNTTPSWERAQPFRFLAHNGEINTIRGNVALMRAREGRLGATDLAAEELLQPVIDASSSDSGVLDQVLELLVRGGRDPRHAMAMMIPPAWEHATHLDSDVRDFFHYHACLLEPWDGPAGIVYADGTIVGATLDRNGLRPLRVSICDDGFVAVASEAGAVSTRGHGFVRRTKLGPGQAFSVSPTEGGILEDSEIKNRLARRAPYGDWLAEHIYERNTGQPLESAPDDVTARQVAAGYTKEEITVVIRPMATEGAEPTSSMGDDTARAPFASHPRSIFNHLKQRFAQVTNPPIDHLREKNVMSIATRLGGRAPLLLEMSEAAALREYPSFVFFPTAVEDLLSEGAAVIDATFAVVDGVEGLERACIHLQEQAAVAARAGADVIVVSDSAVGPDRVAVPSALASGAAHHRLLDEGLRASVSIVVVADDVRESHHVACLLTNGADAVCPRLLLESIAALAKAGRLGGGVSAVEGQGLIRSALEDGVLKIMSKMGISTLDSYRGAQIIEAIGLGPDVIQRCFAGISSALGGLSFVQLATDVLERHAAAFERHVSPANTGFIKHRTGGEYHAINPDVVDSLHAAVGIAEATPAGDEEMAAAHSLQRAARGDAAAYERFSSLVTQRPVTEPRDLLEFVSVTPISVDEVDPVEAITRRFSTGAMSHGALSAEAHETLSVAMNMIGGMANTGEGGEDPTRFSDDRNSGIKQIASGRFGVTPEYLINAKELQIKMAQGSKPGEGGQIPGKKVTEEIARLRHTVPGVALISPPPHHDIYSIEDLAQLIYDLKQANSHAQVSVKLVSSEGVGTIAAGVVKGLADVVHISGGDGGTGASPLSSIKNAGMSWELGLADTHSSLMKNDLRGRTRLRVDGGFKTGRDVVVAALLGADEFSFGTAALIAEGCILVRTCHRNTCPVGIATQDPKLRAKFAGTPEMVARYLTFVAEEVRGLLASLGLRSIDEAVGRTELLRRRTTGNPRWDSVDVTVLLTPSEGTHRFVERAPIQDPRSELGDRLLRNGIDALVAGDDIELDYRITTADRSVGAALACESALVLGGERPEGRVRVRLEGEAGQSFGAFLRDGIEMTLVGEANDYVGKSMSGGRIAVVPPANDAGDPVLVGNTVLYGATGGQLFVAGRAGERFAVRNSGAVALVEGAGDHLCEYMTAGAVVVLGSTGYNVGAGMSGGEIYVYDPDGELTTRLNPQLVAPYEPTAAQLESLRRVIGHHVAATGSMRGRTILEAWEAESAHFKRVAPVAEVARLEAMFEGTAVAAV